MLKFNSFRAKRYLRSRFVEGKYLLASEASDIELELIEALRRSVESTLGSSVAIEDAWKITKLSATQLLVAPGEAWVKGLPVHFRSGKDQLVSGAILTEGIVPVGVQFSDDAAGLGKIITFNNAATTPTNTYKINVTVREELITEIDDPFLQNANLTESTAQKVRLIFQINVVPNSLQTQSPIPYRDEASTAGSPTNYPNTGGSAAPNLVNQIVVTPTAAGNGELISITPITGSEKIDGRDLEIVIRNNPGIGGGIILPNSPTAQLAFSNGALIDSYGNRYHVNQIFNDTVSTQLVIRIDKEPDQPNPQLVNTIPYTLQKRDVYVTDDVNGSPQGRMYWDIAQVNWHQVNGFVHQSSVTDLRTTIKQQDEFQDKSNNKDVLTLVNNNSIAWDATTSVLSWAGAFKFINPSGPDQTIAAASAAMVDGGSLVYTLKLDAGGALQKGNLAINVTAFGTTSSLSAVDLSSVQLGNVVVDIAGTVAYITAIDDVNNTITTNIALTSNGAAQIYLDSYGPQYAPLSIDSVCLAVRSGTKVYLSGLELEDGESGSIGDGVSDELLAYIGAPDESTASPTYTSTLVVSNGDSLTAAIGKLDAAAGLASSGINQDRTMKLIGGGTWSWTLGTNTLAWNASAFLQIANLANTVNEIVAGNAVITAGQVAYVDFNRSGPGGSLTVQVGAIASVTPGPSRVIIARRDGNDIIVGNHSMRLIDAESKKLYAGASDQNLAFIGASTEASNQPTYSSNIRGTANESLQSRAGANTDALGDSQEDRSAYLRSDQPVSWSGAALTFSTDIVLEIINTKSGTVTTHTVTTAGNSPLALVNGESAWVSINRLSASETLTLNKSGTTPIPAQSQANKDVIVLFRRQDALGAGYLHIPLHKQVLEPGQTTRLGASGSGSGSGGNSILETLKNHLIDSIFNLLTPNIFASDTNTKIDGSSTGAYSLVTKTFDYSAGGQTFVSTVMLDPLEFLPTTTGLGEAELYVAWTDGAVDTAAIYEVSRNGGNEWQTITMERIGLGTNEYRGFKTFAEESSNQSLISYAGASAGSNELNATTQQQVGQAFTLTNKSLLRTLTLQLTKTGSPSGNLVVQIVSNNAGSPGTTIYSETNAIAISGLTTGANIINIPDVVLAAGTYHVVLKTDAAYKASFVTATTALAWNQNAGSPTSTIYNGTAWSAGTGRSLMVVSGISLDLRVRITSSTGSVKLDGYGIFYDKAVGNISTGTLARQVFTFSGDANTSSFNITQFVPNPELLKVYDVSTGQVYLPGAFGIQGQQIVFDAGQFLAPGQIVTLVADQTAGGAFDNSDLNALCLATNHLGDPNGVVDRSVAGRGIYLRRPDGTLRELVINDNDEIEIYSV